MAQSSFNCIICGDEYTEEELQGESLSKLNFTSFKICQKCLDKSNPSNDFYEAKKIIAGYLDNLQTKKLFGEEVIIEIED